MTYNNRSVDPLKMTDAAYEKSNKKMRSKHKSETGKTLGSRQTTGTDPRRVSFACRFAGMKGPMKDSKGRPTRKAIALKKWGFGSVGAAASFCRANKAKKKSPMAKDQYDIIQQTQAIKEKRMDLEDRERKNANKGGSKIIHLGS